MANTEFRSVGTFTIPNGGTVSNILDMQDYFICALDVPAMTSTALTIKGSMDGVTFRDVKDPTLATNHSTLTVDGTGAIISLNPQNFAGIRYFQLTAGSAEGAERLIDLLAYRG